MRTGPSWLPGDPICGEPVAYKVSKDTLWRYVCADHLDAILEEYGAGSQVGPIERVTIRGGCQFPLEVI